MSRMLMAPKTRAAGPCMQGPGGRHCTCCDVPPKSNRVTRRHVKRSERQQWRRKQALPDERTAQ